MLQWNEREDAGPVAAVMKALSFPLGQSKQGRTCETPIAGTLAADYLTEWTMMGLFIQFHMATTESSLHTVQSILVFDRDFERMIKVGNDIPNVLNTYRYL
jgi:hypothetical protein